MKEFDDIARAELIRAQARETAHKAAWGRVRESFDHFDEWSDSDRERIFYLLKGLGLPKTTVEVDIYRFCEENPRMPIDKAAAKIEAQARYTHGDELTDTKDGSPTARDRRVKSEDLEALGIIVDKIYWTRRHKPNDPILLKMFKVLKDAKPLED